MNTFPLLRDARCIELDMLDVCTLEFEGNPAVKDAPLLKAFASRIGRLADELEKLSVADQVTRKDALRWQLLFDTPGIRRKRVGSSIHILQDSFASDGSFVGRKLLAVGSNTIDAVDKALGIWTPESSKNPSSP